MVIITGCDSGLGYSLAVHCHEQGAMVIASVLNTISPGAEDLISRGVRVVPLDISNKISMDAFSEEIHEIFKNNQLGE